jgi:ribosomal protein S18 acetylase RimI-like enzyme
MHAKPARRGREGVGRRSREDGLVIEINRVGPEEWRAVRDVRLKALVDSPDWFWATYNEEVDKPEAWWRDFLQAGAWFLACDGARPLGVVAAIGTLELEGSTRQVISMWVAPDARGRGVATRLIDAVKVWARGSGVRELQLQVTENNQTARRLYERCGFELTGRIERLPRNPALVEHEMRLRL